VPAALASAATFAGAAALAPLSEAPDFTWLAFAKGTAGGLSLSESDKGVHVGAAVPVKNAWMWGGRRLHASTWRHSDSAHTRIRSADMVPASPLTN
jgi:hypothetical protein